MCGNTLTDSEFAGLRSMLELELMGWIKSELAPIEQHFPEDAADTQKDFLERIVLYLVSRYGNKIEGTQQTGMLIAEEQLNLMIGKGAELKTEKDNILIIVSK